MVAMSEMMGCFMKTVGLFTNIEKDPYLVYTKKVSGILHSYGFEVVIPQSVIDILRTDIPNTRVGNILDDTDMIISLGGDGTFLKIARMVYEKAIPILGVNLGNLGFLTDIDKDNIQEAIKSISSGEYRIESRMMLDMEIVRNGEIIASDTALNDIVISRGALSRIVYTETFINDVFVDTYPGDGLIVSSPTGSTAYSLSAGGPITEPDNDLIIMTPICPHILYTRSIIVDSSKIVKTVLNHKNIHAAMVTVDGQTGYEAVCGDIILTKKSPCRLNLIKCKTPDFFSILRNKIYYRGGSVG